MFEPSRVAENPVPLGSALSLRVPLFAALFIVLGFLAVGVHWSHHLPQAWELFGLPSLSPNFGDTRTITHSIDRVLSGGDPYVDRSFDPWHRLYNYPPVWLELRHLGVRSTSTKWVAALFGAVFFCSCFALFRARNWITAVTIFLTFLSWPVLFALERGNTDLVIFAVLTLGALWAGRGSRPVSPLKQAALIVVLTILKIFPVVAVLAMVRSRRMIWKALAAGAVAILALVASSGSKLLLIIRNTPQVLHQSFGSLPLSIEFAEPAHRWVIAILLAVTGMALGLLGRDPVTRGLPRLDLYSPRGFIAAAGLTIYGFAFLCGSSYDYRLIFLLCPLMYLVDDLNERITGMPLAATVVLLLFFWSASLGPQGPKEVLDAVVFVGACAWMSYTLRCALTTESASDVEVLQGDALSA